MASEPEAVDISPGAFITDVERMPVDLDAIPQRELIEFAYDDPDSGGTCIGYWNGRQFVSAVGLGMWSPQYVTAWTPVEINDGTELRAARAALDVVRALHQPVGPADPFDLVSWQHCSCGARGIVVMGDGERSIGPLPWPCPTVAALAGVAQENPVTASTDSAAER